jgi:tRNA-specific adenosine deaminase 1
LKQPPPFFSLTALDDASLTLPFQIIAGDAIDQSLGVKLGISTMAAAGLGNMMSDIVGLGIGDIIEGWCHKLGFREPPLTVMQRASKVGFALALFGRRGPLIL